MAALLHSSFEMAALIRVHFPEFLFHGLPALLAMFEDLFALLRRHCVPAFLQLPLFILRQALEPFAGTAQLLAFFWRQFAEAVEFSADLLAMFRRHLFPGLHPPFHFPALLWCLTSTTPSRLHLRFNVDRT